MLKRFSYSLFILFSVFTTLLGHAGNASSFSKNLFSNNTAEEEFLSPDAAFGLDIIQNSGKIDTSFRIAPGYYLYKERIKFVLSPSLDHTVQLPDGDIKNDPNFGKMEVYHHDFTGNIILKNTNNTPINIEAIYQGCSEKGLCYAPQHKTFTIQPQAAAGTPDTKGTGALNTASAGNNTDISSKDSVAADLLKNGKWWLIILGFFTAGLLLSFTPCVFPMIPILSSMIIGKNAHLSRLHAFNLSLAYTLGMCFTYTLAGMAAGLSGQLLSNALQTPLALGFGAIVYVILALSNFGFYELKLPYFIENKFLNWNRRVKGGGYFSDFVMGVLSALIISPCVAAPLAGALLYISQTHDLALGGVALFSLSIGMGTPLLLIGASAGSVLPKVGSWMTVVRNFFGVTMLGMAIWLISPIIPVSLQLALWAALLIVPAIFMRAIDPLPADAKPILRFWKGIAIMLLVTGLAMLVGALSNTKSPLQPLGGLLAKNTSSQEQHSSLNFKRVKNLAELDTQLKAAQGKLVMLDFYADWCVSCKEMEQFTFNDQRVQNTLKDTVLLQVDVTNNTEDDKALLQKFNLFGPPGILFFNQKAEQETHLKVVGYQNADDFLQILNQRGSCLPETTQC